MGATGVPGRPQRDPYIPWHRSVPAASTITSWGITPATCEGVPKPRSSAHGADGVSRSTHSSKPSIESSDGVTLDVTDRSRGSFEVFEGSPGASLCARHLVLNREAGPVWHEPTSLGTSVVGPVRAGLLRLSRRRRVVSRRLEPSPCYSEATASPVGELLGVVVVSRVLRRRT